MNKRSGRTLAYGLNLSTKKPPGREVFSLRGRVCGDLVYPAYVNLSGTPDCGSLAYPAYVNLSETPDCRS